ncbi:MAG TPA: hypothetical protein VLR88_04075 [Propionibacteriaceae bacterium]|nr:hypothetical protein [Propionibacteriaceae bacterium]
MFDLSWWTVVMFAVAVVAVGYIIGLLIRALAGRVRASKKGEAPRR